MNTREKLASMKAQQERAIRVAEEIARLEETIANRPKEPPVDAVVAFEKSWTLGGRAYNYVAYQAVEGYWYLSQSNYNSRSQFPRMTWDELLDFVGDEEAVFIATAWEQLV